VIVPRLFSILASPRCFTSTSKFFFQIIANGLVTHKVALQFPIDAHLFQAFSGVISLSTANIIIFALENSEIILHFTRQ